MTQCTNTKNLLSSYLDGAMTGVEMHQVSDHLKDCIECRTEYVALKNTQALVTAAGKRPAPPELALRLRVALQHERTRSQNPWWRTMFVRMERAVQAFLLPATTGLVSASIVFVTLGGFMALPSSTAAASSDIPTSLYTPPHLTSTPESELTGYFDTPVVVKAYIGPDGRVIDYRILSGPKTNKQLRTQVENTLMFSQFQPAMAFGQPSSGTVVVSFSNEFYTEISVHVKG